MSERVARDRGWTAAHMRQGKIVGEPEAIGDVTVSPPNRWHRDGGITVELAGPVELKGPGEVDAVGFFLDGCLMFQMDVIPGSGPVTLPESGATVLRPTIASR